MGTPSILRWRSMAALGCLSIVRPQLPHLKTALPLRSPFTHPHLERASAAIRIVDPLSSI